MISWDIICGDCVDVLPTVGRGSARLIFADPPYNIGIDYGNDHDDKIDPEAYVDWTESWIYRAVETLTGDGSIWVMINHEYAADVEIVLRSAGTVVRNWITWYETFGVNCTRKFNRTSRRIFHAVKDPKHFVFHVEAVRRPSDRQVVYNDPRANPDGKLLDDVWEVPRLVGTAKERIPGFPTQVPLEILNRIVACASDPGDLVVDPFSGSGSTGAAAVGLGRRYLGIERSREFVDRSRQRMRDVQRVFDVFQR